MLSWTAKVQRTTVLLIVFFGGVLGHHVVYFRSPGVLCAFNVLRCVLPLLSNSWIKNIYDYA